MPWTVWRIYIFLSRSNLIKGLFWKINNNRVDSGSIWKLFDFNHLSPLLSEWHHHDFPLSFFQVQYPLRVSLDYLYPSELYPCESHFNYPYHTLRVIYPSYFGHTCKSSTLVWCNCLLSLSVLSAESCSRKIT